MRECVALVPAAGLGSRMGARKAYLPYKGQPLLALTLSAISKVPEITRVVVALHQDDMALWSRNPLWPKEDQRPCHAVIGGATRAHSVEAAFNKAAEDIGSLDFLVAVHDAARPFTDGKLFASIISHAAEGSAASCALDLVDTVKEVDPQGRLRTLERSRLKCVQTPQVIHARDFHRGIALWKSRGCPAVTDDLQIVEELGLKVTLLKGDPRNIKITHPLDLTAGNGLEVS